VQDKNLCMAERHEEEGRDENMKIISLSAPEILKATLNRRKRQTIRPLFDKDDPFNMMKIRAPRFKVGEQAQLMWKQRSTAKDFCRSCGTGYMMSPVAYYCPNLKCKGEHECNSFPKPIGIVKITEVFKLEMCNGLDGDFIKPVKMKVRDYKKFIEDFAVRDGFKDAAQMFAWFSSQYHLAVNKPLMFACYRWEVVKWFIK
jgi:hypothetical protein